jgi:hypothetical protein
MHSTKLAAVSLTLALCFSQSYLQAQSQAIQAPATAAGSLPFSEAYVAANETTEIALASSLAYRSPIVSSSWDGYENAFMNTTGTKTGMHDDLRSGSDLGGKSKISYSREDKLTSRPFSKLAVGIKVSTLGAGLEFATPLARNVNYAVFGYNFNLDGIDYTTNVNFRSAQMSLDWFPFHGGFHISPGFLYFKNGLSGQANVPPGQRFSLDDTNYINSVDDPVSGTAAVSFDRNAAPMLTLGWGNLLPRSGRHFSVPFEFGVAYSGPAKINVKIAGTACTKDGCFNAALDPDTQANLNSELKDINEQAAKYPIFPIVSLGFAYRF